MLARLQFWSFGKCGVLFHWHYRNLTLWWFRVITGTHVWVCVTGTVLPLWRGGVSEFSKPSQLGYFNSCRWSELISRTFQSHLPWRLPFLLFCARAYIRRHTHAHTHIHTHAHTHSLKHKLTHNIHTYTLKHKLTHTHTHMHTLSHA